MRRNSGDHGWSRKFFTSLWQQRNFFASHKIPFQKSSGAVTAKTAGSSIISGSYRSAPLATLKKSDLEQKLQPP